MRTLTKSSIISLTAETKRIKHSGTNVVNRPVGDTSGICYNEITHEYTHKIRIIKIFNKVELKS